MWINYNYVLCNRVILLFLKLPFQSEISFCLKMFILLGKAYFMKGKVNLFGNLLTEFIRNHYYLRP